MLLLQAVPVYFMMIVLPPKIARHTVLLFTMTFLSWAHIQRLHSSEVKDESIDITAYVLVYFTLIC